MTDDPVTPNSIPLKAGKLPGPLLARLLATYATPDDDDVIVPSGYGRDAAAIQLGDQQLIVKSDPITFATDGAARYLVAVNANDIACLGGIPRWLSVVALLPEKTSSEESVEALFRDLQTACVAARISLIGGHTEITIGLDRPLLIGTMLGTAGAAGILQPGGAKIGDDLYVSKWVGIEGTALLAREHADRLRPIVGPEIVRSAAKLLRSPGISVARDAAILLATGRVHALHDPTEGGVATAIHEIAEASSLGAEIDVESVPMLPETRILCDHYGIDPLGLLSSGALLIVGDPDGRQDLERAATEGGVPLSWIGRIVSREDGVTMLGPGGRTAVPRFDSDEVTRVL
ncbi:MAG TPA: AIR synthase-related protein [Thermomicrobiales bacterium]|nr:AIR synthase-related protein [Thermomicrobiales bacterium]